jgi:nucleoside-diphosphate-sugar epimerase
MNILITGGAGYLGSILIPKLLARGHKLRVVEIGYFGVSHLRSLRPGIELLREDVRRFCEDRRACANALENMDCVIHLAAISNDPSAELNPVLTEQVNFHSTQALAEAAKAKAIRFIFSSSCSVYGEAPGEVDENGAVNPLSAYAHSKVNSDRFLASITTSNWRPISLRNGTLFGYSPRMRFDLVINIFSFMSTLYNELRVFGDGLQWRPFLHVSDCARAFVHFAEARECEHLIYNIANENLRVVDLVAVFKRMNPRVEVKYVPTADKDARNYHVSTSRMKEAGFKPLVNVELGAEEMVDAIVTGLVADPESIFYRNAKWMKELTQFGDSSHKEFIGLMEAMAQVMPQRR